MTSIAIEFINAKYGNADKVELIALRKEAAKELREIKAEKDDVFNRYEGVHGRFQHSQLDVLDIREYKVCAIIDNLDNMIAAR